ncbi:Dyp-type peroxidase [Streptomyces antimicrobicus]|uniref:Peroxidase n=1 Tax=Streptomyces antimicrobicus TaxID=2883108 RepID=A0ABS8BAA5_9ACTN|nr:peroxidase [Streptomyces antimicrobicus]MCB5181558.1 peroxidase [Streptomyces antimicrobicus]
MMAVSLELHDIQGIVARGYSTLTSACFLLLAIADPDAARPALDRVAQRATDGRAEPAEAAVNLAFTAEGLRRLGLRTTGATAATGFSREFLDGMTEPNRSRLLGDTGENAPHRWRWGGPDTPPVHVLVLLYARDERRLDRLETQVREELTGGGALSEVLRLGTAELTDREPFGFRDGISQPLIEGLPKAEGSDRSVKAGEFVLGYPNEYGLLTDRPLLPAVADPGGLLPRAPERDGDGGGNEDGGGSGDGDGGEGDLGLADLGRNGSYLVLRQLHQDVPAFRAYLDAVTRRPDGSPDPEARDALAARMVGRWPSGAPLVRAPDHDDPGLADANDFGYFATDPEGLRCPLGAHVRRAHPRDSLDPDPGSARSEAIGRRHRLLRRGRAYGPEGAGDGGPGGDGEADGGSDRGAEGDGGPDGGGASGLHFVCLSANLSRQFEFVQHTWLNNPAFNGLLDGPCPLVGPRQDHRSTFTVQARPVRTRYRDLPQFVTVRGGAYFFLPGLRALRYLCAGPRGRADTPRAAPPDIDYRRK